MPCQDADKFYLIGSELVLVKYVGQAEVSEKYLILDMHAVFTEIGQCEPQGESPAAMRAVFDSRRKGLSILLPFTMTVKFHRPSPLRRQFSVYVPSLLSTTLALLWVLLVVVVPELETWQMHATSP